MKQEFKQILWAEFGALFLMCWLLLDKFDLGYICSMLMPLMLIIKFRWIK